MKLHLPNPSLLHKTGDVDYYNWNYKFPIKYVQQYRFKAILKLLGNSSYNRLLEFGTGSGIFLPELSTRCENLYACDVHPNFDGIGKMLSHYGIKNVDLRQQGIEKTDYPDNYFDAIVAVSVLEFVNDLHMAINEIKRILKPDGCFVTICPMQSKMLDMILSIYTDRSADEEFKDSRLYVTTELESGFKVIQRGYMMPVIGRYFPIYTHYKLNK